VGRLSTSGGYAGETWNIPANELNGPAPGVVRIVVETPARQPRRRRVRVEADYPANSDTRARQSKEVSWDLDRDTKEGRS
jgi:hypothetical protein